MKVKIQVEIKVRTRAMVILVKAGGSLGGSGTRGNTIGNSYG